MFCIFASHTELICLRFIRPIYAQTLIPALLPPPISDKTRADFQFFLREGWKNF